MQATTSIKSGITKGVMLIVLFFLVQAALVGYIIYEARSTVVENTRSNTVASSQLERLAVLAQQIRRYEKEYFIYTAIPQKRAGYEREWRDAFSKIETMLESMKTDRDGAFDARDIEQITAWGNAASFYASEMLNIIVTVNERTVAVTSDRETRAYGALASRPGEGQHASAAVSATAPLAAYTAIELNEMIKPGKERFSDELVKGVEAMVALKSDGTLALAREAELKFTQVLVGMVSSAVAGIAIALLLSQRLPMTAIRPIESLSQAAHDMSLGDLSKEFDAGGVVEFEKLVQALNRMRVGHQALVDLLQKR
ncbi:MAG: HAMP domain-containing protein [Rhodoferax sp.]|nr:HAMP domain-containing protein [Rhodoferax sp.]